MDRDGTAALLREARAGSEDALEILYRRYAGRLLALIRLRMGPELRSRVESRDILQASLLKSFERIERFEPSGTGSLMSWLARIAENEIRDQVKFQRRQRRDARQNVSIEDAPGDLEAKVRSTLSRVILGEKALGLERALEALPGHYREVIVLRKLEENSWSEIARKLGKSEDACRMLLARAMTALTLEMDES